eukprot:12696196-Heterocapsa_arctica.AAC.1
MLVWLRGGADRAPGHGPDLDPRHAALRLLRAVGSSSLFQCAPQVFERSSGIRAIIIIFLAES